MPVVPLLVEHQRYRPGVRAARGIPRGVDTEAALRFLAAHQPMPTDDVLGDDEIQEFDAIRHHFIADPDPRCIPLLLRSLPKGSSGFGVYQLVEDVLRVHPEGAVVDALDEALTADVSSHEWILDLSLSYLDQRLLEHARRYSLQGDEMERDLARVYLEVHSSEQT